jgi:hypothetical protein
MYWHERSKQLPKLHFTRIQRRASILLGMAVLTFVTFCAASGYRSYPCTPLQVCTLYHLLYTLLLYTVLYAQHGNDSTYRVHIMHKIMLSKPVHAVLIGTLVTPYQIIIVAGGVRAAVRKQACASDSSHNSSACGCPTSESIC